MNLFILKILIHFTFASLNKVAPTGKPVAFVPLQPRSIPVPVQPRTTPKVTPPAPTPDVKPRSKAHFDSIGIVCAVVVTAVGVFSLW